MKKLVLFVALGLIAAEPAKVAPEKLAAHSAKVVDAYQSTMAVMQAQERQKAAIEAMTKSLAALRKEAGVADECDLVLATGQWNCPAKK